MVILWLQQQGVKLPVALLPDSVDCFLAALQNRLYQLHQNEQMHQDFIFEMQRFLPLNLVDSTIKNLDFWTILTESIQWGSDEIFLAFG